MWWDEEIFQLERPVIMRLYLFHWASLRSIGDRCAALGSFLTPALYFRVISFLRGARYNEMVITMIVNLTCYYILIRFQLTASPSSGLTRFFISLKKNRKFNFICIKRSDTRSVRNSWNFRNISRPAECFRQKLLGDGSSGSHFMRRVNKGPGSTSLRQWRWRPRGRR